MSPLGLARVWQVWFCLQESPRAASLWVLNLTPGRAMTDYCYRWDCLLRRCSVQYPVPGYSSTSACPRTRKVRLARNRGISANTERLGVVRAIGLVRSYGMAYEYHLLSTFDCTLNRVSSWRSA